MTTVGPMFNFEDICQTTGSASAPWQGRLTISPELPFLRGHFPETPIVPAVAILEASHAFVAKVGGSSARLVASAKHCKFRQPMGPGETFLITATSERDGHWHIVWTPERGGEAVVEVGLVTRA